MISRRTVFLGLAGVVLGGLAGGLYYHFVGCEGGTCPITSRPVPSILYGALIGFLLSGLGSGWKRKKRE